METSNKEKKPSLYAVYGTLRRGFRNYENYLNNNDCILLGTMKTTPNFKMVNLGAFPGVIPNAGTQEVIVEIFQINKKEIERHLDYLEGYPKFYQKMEIDTQWGRATMYILTEEEHGHLPIIESGDWKEHLTNRRRPAVVNY